MRRVAGVAVWAALIIGAVVVVERSPGASTALGRVASFCMKPRAPVYHAQYPRWAWVKPGHQVRRAVGDTFVVAGEVVAAVESGEKLDVTVRLYPEFASDLCASATLEAVSSSGDMTWIVKTLLPPEKMAEIRRILAGSFDADKDKLWREIEPGVTRLVGEIAKALRDDMPRLVEMRKSDFTMLADVLRERAWDAHLEKTFLESIWPATENRALPLLTKIADEIAQRAPVWSLSWSYVRGRLPWGDDDALRRRVRQFIDAEVLPIVKLHRDDFKKGAVEQITETLRDERVLRDLEQSFADVLADDRFRGAIRAILETWMLDNDKLATIVKSAFDRPDIRKPLQNFFDAREDDINAIANLIIMDPVTRGISPDLARVLRRKILGEGGVWLLLDPGAGERLPANELRGVVGGEK